MLAARMHEYQKPLAVEEGVPVTSPGQGEGVLVRVGGAGLCHSDLHLMGGEWKDAIPLPLPMTPGHEVAGWVEEVGKGVPPGMFSKGDVVAVFGGWGCGVCPVCKRGDEQMCPKAQWPGLSRYDGGYAQFIYVPSYRFLVKAGPHVRPQELAPLTDAGLTPYRAIRRFRHLLLPGTAVAVVGIGGLGSYGIQYAKLLGPNSLAIAIDRSEKKLDLARSKLGADHAVAISGQARKEVMELTGGRGVDLVVDCVGAESTIALSASILARSGALAVVGLFGSKITVPLMPAVINEHVVTGSLWGNYNELAEVVALASQGKVRHVVQTFRLGDINKAVEELREGRIAGRAVIVPENH